jgi:hypothetical protein
LSASQIDTDYWISQIFNSNKQGMNLVVERNIVNLSVTPQSSGMGEEMGRME